MRNVVEKVKLIDGQLSNVAGYCYYEDMDPETQEHIDNLLDRRNELTNGVANDGETDNLVK